MIKTIFFGTHQFATTILQGLIDSPNISIDLVITQPDKPVGRKKILTPPPVKILAEKNGISVEQPKTLKTYNLKLTTDLNIVAEYGKIIPKHILDTPKLGSINVHTSLLPKYRGASPIQSALINGEAETGVTIMKMDEGLDTGPILLQKALKIEPKDTYPIVDQKLAKLGRETLLEAIPAYVSRELLPKEQDNTKATTCNQFSREDGRVDWHKSNTDIFNLFRGLTPWPGIWTMLGDKRLKLLEIEPSNKSVPVATLQFDDDKVFIGCNKGSILVSRLQLEGKKEVSGEEFVRGNKNLNNCELN